MKGTLAEHRGATTVRTGGKFGYIRLSETFDWDTAIARWRNILDEMYGFNKGEHDE